MWCCPTGACWCCHYPITAFQNVFKRVDFRIAASDVAQCHYNQSNFTAHRRDVLLCMALAEQETLNDVSCVVWFFCVRTVLSTTSQKPVGTLVSHARAFTVGNDLPYAPVNTLSLSMSS